MILSRSEKILLFLVLLLLLGLAAAEVHSFDVFWQLQSGKYMAQTRSFLFKDTFSLASEATRFEHCWLHDLIFYGAFLLGGYGAISLLKGLLVAGTSLALFVAARVRNSSRLAILCVGPPSVLMTFWAWKERPQLWTYLLFALFILVIERYRRSGGRTIYLLLPLMILWANLHAGSVLAFPVLAAYLVGEGVSLLLKRSGMGARNYLRLWWVAALLLAASLVTPYGWMTLKTLLQAPSLGESSGAVTQVANIDWNATTFRSYPAYFYAMGISLFVMLLGWKRLVPADVLLLGGLAFMGLKLERHTPFLFLGMAALLPAYCDAALRPVTSRMGEPWVSRAKGVGLLLALAMTLYWAQTPYRDYGFFDLGLRKWHYPVEEAVFVKEQRLPGNIFNSYGAGGYLMWTLYPEYQVFWDGRQNDSQMFTLGMQVSRGRAGWEEILDRFSVNTIVMEACSQADGGRFPLLDRLRESSRWVLVRAGESHLVFVRRNAVEGGWLEEHRLPDSRIDETILSEATLISRVTPRRPRAYWEMARVYMETREYRKAFSALSAYLTMTPASRREPAAEVYYRVLTQMPTFKESNP